MKSGDGGFYGFGEAYFSQIAQGEVKGWKMHNEMTLNLLVPIGEIEIVVCDGTKFFSLVLSLKNYKRITIKPKLWFGFKGLEKNNMLLNLASHHHDPEESKNVPIANYKFKWSSIRS